MRADEIKDQESFKAWLNTRKRQLLLIEAISLAHRSSMRVLPLVHQQGSQKLNEHFDLIKSTIWANDVVRIANTSNAVIKSFIEFDHAIAISKKYIQRAAGKASFSDASVASAAVRAASIAVRISSVETAPEAAASSAFFASRAASTASYDSQHAANDIWNMVRSDAKNLESGLLPQNVLAKPLWFEAPRWWQEGRDDFFRLLNSPDFRENGFDIWTEWYATLATGKPLYGIRNDSVVQILDRNIALGSTNGKFDESFWNREPKAVNVDIARWVKEAQQRDREVGLYNEVIISHHRNDAVNALEVYPVLKQLGYRPGTFSELTQRKSAASQLLFSFPRRFVALISEGYFLDAVTIGEWNRAKSEYQATSRSRLVPVLLKPVVLPVEVRGMAPIPLYDRSVEEAQDDLRRALSFDPLFISAQQARQAARNVATHRGFRTQDGQWDIGRTPDDLKPFIDSDILKLPQTVQKIAEILIESLGHQNSNAPGFVVGYLKECISEFKEKGPTFDASNVKSWVNLFELEVAECADEGWVQKHRNPINQFLGQHSKLLQHYPAILRREYLALQSPIDPNVFDDPEFARRLDNLRNATVAARQRGEITEQFLTEVEGSCKKLRALVAFGQAVPGHGKRLLSNTGELPLSAVRKKEAFEKGGTMDRIGSDMGEIAKGAAGEVVGALVMEALKGIGKLIFNSS